MCRYSFYNYKITYGCFNCQVGFKRRNLNDIKPDELTAASKIGEDISKDFRCPNCGGEMANLGRDLRLPAKTKNEQWACIKYLIDNKYNIYSCGCQGIGFVPHKMSDAIALVAESKNYKNTFQKQYDIQRKLEEKQKAQRKREKEKTIKKQLKEIRKEEKNKKE
jgi:hypothetical protein